MDTAAQPPHQPDGLMNQAPHRVSRALLCLSLIAPIAIGGAQQSKPVPIPRLTEAQQVASAVLALPVQFRADARVLGYKSGSKELVPLRDTKGSFTCLAPQPDEPLHLANEHFNRGDYGVAERYYRDAVEKAPRDVTAWIGLAACYDRIGRFDLADRAYASAIKLNGETTELLNNEGFSYMLRGDLVRARKKLLKAYQRDPNNPTILNNLKLLDGSSNIIRRNANP